MEDTRSPSLADNPGRDRGAPSRLRQTCVRFSDAFGTAYRIVRVDNSNGQFILERISDESKASALFREHRYADSVRGKELRLVGLRKEESRLFSQIKEQDGVVARQKDLHKADSLFMHGIYMYEVSAGVTASQGQSDDALFDEAKRNLEEFLKGLHLSKGK